MSYRKVAIGVASVSGEYTLTSILKLGAELKDELTKNSIGLPTGLI